MAGLCTAPAARRVPSHKVMDPAGSTQTGPPLAKSPPFVPQSGREKMLGSRDGIFVGCSPSALLKSRPSSGCLLPWVSNKVSSHEAEKPLPRFIKRLHTRAHILAKEMLHKIPGAPKYRLCAGAQSSQEPSKFLGHFFFFHLKEASERVFIALTLGSHPLRVDISCQLNAGNVMICTQNANRYI